MVAMIVLGWVLILSGLVVVLAEAKRLVFPRLFPNHTFATSLKFGAINMHAPYPLLFAVVLVGVGYGIASSARHVGCTQEVYELNRRLQRAVVVADSLAGRIRDLQTINASFDRDVSDSHFVKIAFGAAVPLPFLGRGVTGMLQSTADPHVDLMIFSGTLGYSDDLKSEFDSTQAVTGFRYSIGKRFFVKAQDEKIWGVIVSTRVDQNTILCQFFVP